MADLGQLQQKWIPVINTINSFSAQGAKVEDVSLAGDKLHLKATVPSQVILDRVWDSIKSVDPQYSDLQHEITNVGGQQTYTVQSGDSLSKISKYFYGDMNHYKEIAQANSISDPNKIQAGATLTIPVLSGSKAA